MIKPDSSNNTLTARGSHYVLLTRSDEDDQARQQHLSSNLDELPIPVVRLKLTPEEGRAFTPTLPQPSLLDTGNGQGWWQRAGGCG